MKKEDLEQVKNNNRQAYQLLMDNILGMEETIEVKNYILEVKKMEQQKEYQEYLDKLEIGEDGTVFESVTPDNTKSYGLSYLFNCAISLRYYGSDKDPNTGVDFTYDVFLYYLKNAQTVLQDNKKYAGDPLENNTYDLEVYQNPANTQIIEKEEYQEFIESLNNNRRIYALTEVLDKYNVNSAILYKQNVPPKQSFFMVLARDIPNIDLVEIEGLTSREQEAFFGETAQRILGVEIELPVKSSNKEYKKNKR